MRAEHLFQWLIAATRDDSPDATNCLKVVAIVQAALQDGTLAKECMCKTVILITKRKGDLRGFDLIEVLWKAIVSLINRWSMAEISFHDTLHVFRSGRGTGTAALDANLLQQITAMREAVLFKVFLDLWKAYDNLDQDRGLKLLDAYEVGPRAVRLLQTYWYQLTMVAKAGGYFGHLFKGYQGVTQGNPLYPNIFNMVVGVLIRHWVTVVTPPEEDTGDLV